MGIDALRAKVTAIVADNPPLDDFVSGVISFNRGETDVEFPSRSALVVTDILERLHPQVLSEQPPHGSNNYELIKEQQELERIIELHEKYERPWRTVVALTTILKVISDVHPSTQPSSITAALTALVQEFPKFVGDLVDPLFWKESLEADVLPKLRKQLWANVCLASGMPIDRLVNTPRHVWPEHSKLPRSALFHTYLKDTPLQRLTRLRVPAGIPKDVLHTHVAIFAPPDHGKTQLLQTIIHDLLQDDPPAMFIMDSHGDMLRNLKPIVPADKLVVIDPVTKPPQLNFFDTSGTQADTLFKYLMTAIDREFTSKQESTVIYLLRLMHKIPNPTLWKFVEILQDPAKRIDESKFAQYIRLLDPVAQGYFATLYFSSDEKKTRSQIGSRVYSLLGNQYFQNMFSADKNTFDPYELMENGKIVLINTSATHLAEASAVFGRYIIIQIVMAAFKRADIPEHKRKLALLIMDEAHAYFDETTEKILDECRKWKVGCVFATQHIGKMSDSLRKTVAASTVTKLVGPVSVSDARFLAGEMRTHPELFSGMKKEKQYAEFGMFIRNVTPRAIKVQVPFGVVATQTGDAPVREQGSRPASQPASLVDLRDHDDIVEDYDHVRPSEWEETDEA